MIVVSKVQISTVACSASNATVAIAHGIAAMDGWDWFWAISGILYVVYLIYQAPRKVQAGAAMKALGR